MSTACILCGSETEAFIHPNSHVSFYECSLCKAIFKDRKHLVSLDMEKARYDTHNNGFDNMGYVQMFNRFIDEAVLPYRKHGDALDYGCGPVPVLAELMKQKGDFKIDLYDKFYTPAWIHGDKTYDVITTTEVVEHLEDPVETFLFLSRHLKPDGYLSVMTQFRPMDQKTFLDWYYIRDMTHLVFYAEETLRWLGKACGLAFVYTDHRTYAIFKKT